MINLFKMKKEFMINIVLLTYKQINKNIKQ